MRGANQWKTHCRVCGRLIILTKKKTILLPHPKRDGTGRCPGSGPRVLAKVRKGVEGE